MWQACKKSIWHENKKRGARGWEIRDGESTACPKGTPRCFFFRSLREQKIPIGSEAPEGINGHVDWPRKLSSGKLSIKGNTRSFQTCKRGKDVVLLTGIGKKAYFFSYW